MIDGWTVEGRFEGGTEKWQFHTEIILCLISAWFPSSYSYLSCGEEIGRFYVASNNYSQRHTTESNGEKSGGKKHNTSTAYGSPVWPRLYQPQLSKWIPPPPHSFRFSAKLSKNMLIFDIFQSQLVVTVTWSRLSKRKRVSECNPTFLNTSFDITSVETESDVFFKLPVDNSRI